MRGKKTSDKDKEKVKAVIYMNPTADKSELARLSGVPRTTIIEMMKDEHFLDRDKFDTLRQQKKEEFIQEAWEVVKKAMLALGTKVEMLLKDPESLSKANIRDIAVALGTIYDKQALASGEPTIISERQEPTPELVKELEEKVKKLKEMTGA
jgi:MinD-like ATPase involved in chromosome partitioning or flagellar assembly